MKRTKTFDCVEMKRSIQEQIEKEFAGVPEEEARSIQRERIAADPILAPFLKKVRIVETNSPAIK